MIMGQKRRIAPPTAHDHEKPNDWRGKLSTGEANVRRVKQESPLPSGGKRPQAAQAAGRKRQAGATTAGFYIRLMTTYRVQNLPNV
jgi:hypothetical protein